MAGEPEIAEEQKMGSEDTAKDMAEDADILPRNTSFSDGSNHSKAKFFSRHS